MRWAAILLNPAAHARLVGMAMASFRLFLSTERRKKGKELQRLG